MAEPLPRDLKPWMVALGSTIMILLIIAVGAFYGPLPMAAAAACLGVGGLVGLLVGREVGEQLAAHRVTAVTKQISFRDEALRFANARIAHLEQESAARLAQGDEAASRAEAHLAELKKLRREVSGG